MNFFIIACNSHHMSGRQLSSFYSMPSIPFVPAFAQSFFLPDAFALAHLARAMAASLAFAAAGIFRRPALGAGFAADLPLSFAHLARCAFAIRARAEADIFLLGS